MRIGESHRTSEKLRAVRTIVKRQVLDGFGPLVLLDMNSGDAGVGRGVRRWQEGSTPAILAHVAMNRPDRPIEIRLHERCKANFDYLMQMLERELPRLSASVGRFVWIRTGLSEWSYGAITLSVASSSSDVFHDFPDDADVVVVHDPNTFSGWSMGADVLISLEKVDAHPVTFSALGFNAMGARRSVGQPWWEDKVALMEMLCGDSEEALLMLIDPGDSQRWAYLITADITTAFDLRRRVLDAVRAQVVTISLRSQPVEFGRLVGLLTAA